jgi:nitrous oxidase accessory protein
MRSVVALLALALAPAAAGAATLTVPGDHATIQAAVDASQPGDVIQIARGSYSEAVLVTGKQDLTLQGKGKPTLGGAGATPLSIENSSGVTVTGLVVAGSPDHAILIAGSSDVTVSRCTLRSAENGIRTHSSSRLLIEKNRIEGVGSDGVDFDNSDGAFASTVDSVVSKNRIEGAGDEAIEIEGSGHRVEKNRVTQSGEDGINTDADSTGVMLDKNRIDRAGRGIRLEGTGHTVTNNRIRAPGEEGISVRGADHRVERNRISAPSDDGIDVEASGNVITANRIKNPNDDGFEIGDEKENSVDNLFESNKVKGARHFGFRVRDGGNTFRRNKASKSGDFDLSDESGTGTNLYEDNRFGTEQLL